MKGGTTVTCQILNIHLGGKLMSKLSPEIIERLFSELNITTIDDNTNYWFIRTDSGNKFEDFYFGNYVAIGWDKFNDIEYIKNTKHDDLKFEVEKQYPEEKKPGSIAGQLHKFVNDIKIGDFVLIPSANCDRIAFGKITGNVEIYEPTDKEKMDAEFDEIELDYFKRRSVKWFGTPYKRHEIDPLIIPIIYSHGAVVSANSYENFINRTLFPIYYKNEELHTIYYINKISNISAFEFHRFLDNFFKTMDIYADAVSETVDKDTLQIKASFNSPGPVEIITATSSFFIIISGIAIFLNGGNINLNIKAFKLFEAKIEFNSPGLLDKLLDFKKIDQDEKKDLEDIAENFKKAANELEIKNANLD